jgi:probable HAF family extracellular repeat protein
MRSTNLIEIALTASLTLAMMTPLAAQQQARKHQRYKLIDLGTFGGPHSNFNGGSRIINRKGTAVGGASTSTPDPLCLFDFPNCFVYHAGKYENGSFYDLGSLAGGANSFANAINSSGVVVGVSGNSLTDPATGLPAGVATAWKANQIIDLGTFGGSFSMAGDINDQGEIAGGAENTIPDPFDFGGLAGLPSPTQWRATLWQHGTMRDLGTLGNGDDSFTQFVNKHSQAAGASFTDSIVNPETGIPTPHPFFWESGQMVDVGSLGGLISGVSGLNDSGQIAGTSDLAGDQTAHPFLWAHGSMRDLGTLGGSFGAANWMNDNGEVIGGSTTPNDEAFDGFLWRNGVMTDLGSVAGDGCSNAFGINSRGQVVGESFSCSVDSHHAFLWENGGPAIDLNTFVPLGSDLQLTEAEFIGEGGEIAGAARLANGDFHAFLLIPDDKVDDNPANAAPTNQSDVALATPRATQVTHGKLTPERLAELRARFAQHNRGFGSPPHSE